MKGKEGDAAFTEPISDDESDNETDDCRQTISHGAEEDGEILEGDEDHVDEVSPNDGENEVHICLLPIVNYSAQENEVRLLRDPDDEDDDTGFIGGDIEDLPLLPEDVSQLPNSKTCVSYISCSNCNSVSHTGTRVSGG